jgi:hypothetical protein
VAIEDDKTFYTETMARLHASQGRHDSAVRIYRHLMEQHPDRTDLKKALEDALSAMAEAAGKWETVGDLVEQWVRLIVRQRALRRMNGLAGFRFSTLSRGERSVSST